MQTAEIRRRWLDYFAARGHAVVPSASLISEDPSLLFTVAGMVPFIPYMLGERTPPWPRATSVQKCVRTLDIDEVGKTTRHGTFFQMNGNFSFGDYFKAGAIEYAWELVTGSQADGFYGFDADKVWVTVYEEDDEAASLWREITGMPVERIQRRGKKDNYWNTGQPGPAGPCSEIYIDRGPKYGAEGGPVVDEERFLEIWNLVFMQYEITDVKSKEDFRVVGELAKKNIDTGLGLERVAFLLQGVDNMYEIDEVFPVIGAVEQLANRRYGANHDDDVRMRVVADHVRSGMMLISDGVTPSNEGRGYVLRRLLRRSVRAMRLLGVEDRALPELLPVSKEAMKASYPELESEFDRISQTAYAEEDAFRRTLSAGTTILDTAVATVKSSGGHTLSGDAAFTLHDTYGFPIDLTLEMAGEQGVTVDQQAFTELMREQRERARADARAKKTGHIDTTVYTSLLADVPGGVEFLGYTDLMAEVTVRGLLEDGRPVPMVSAGHEVEVITDRSPFYAESGGQLADEGVIELPGGALRVWDVQRPVPGLIVHKATVTSGEVALGSTGVARVDEARRTAIARAHTATHMVHKALHETLGKTATQAGSENSPSRLRFDFRYGSSVSPDAMSEIEERVNTLLTENLEVIDRQMPLDEARAMGAMALFGEKYGNVVRVVSIGGDWSIELCGGTHVKQSGELGSVTLLGESSIGSGVRRLDALVGSGAYGYHAKERALVSQLTDLMKVRSEELPERVAGLMSRLRKVEKELEATRRTSLLAAAGTIAASAQQLPGGLRVAVHRADDAKVEDLRALATDVRSRFDAETPAVVVMAGVAKDRPLVIVAVNEAGRRLGAKAGSLVKVAASVMGGGGGGKDDLAQGGGSDVTKLPAALDAVLGEAGRLEHVG